MFVGVSLLAISLSILIYHHPPSTWKAWLFNAAGTVPGTTSENISRYASVEQPTPAEKTTEAEPQIQPDPETVDLSRSSLSPQTTPKATPADTQNGTAIPTFSLEAHESSEDEEEDLPPPSFPALNSAQRTSTQPNLMAPPPKPTLVVPPLPKPTSAPSQLMPPPPRIVPSNLRPLPTPSQSMHIPTTGSLPNRGPVPNRGPPISNRALAPQATAGLTVKTPNARGKVLLSPGHSPLDWANLQRSCKNLSGVSYLIRVTPSQLKQNNGRKGKPAWSSYQGRVYNITPYLPFHPGGEGELRRAAGKDGGKLFMEVHPWVNWENMLGECLVGIMVSEEGEQMGKGTLEDMD
ncbi:hypothetical protein K469DRAFT_716785 [Zopfia rhizophila CBS 207.26]|uniref:Cytochrome b5 heme-binding domain-containing protein n=1 Tax=Zopfia rhizophila CBS 207.26 TaxID=1314779 RepID=A0A6A6EL00_9PEZI|nr:hypothetical protein K469DRAFT_716785 [Zopfia rhizophila CBS 207.26]